MAQKLRKGDRRGVRARVDQGIELDGECGRRGVWEDVEDLSPCLSPSREEDSLNGSKGDEPLGKAVGAGDPLEGPVGLLLDGRHGVDGVEERGLLLAVLDVALNEERVHF